MTHITPAPEHIDRRRGIDHIGVGIVAVIHDGQGRILLMKRGQKARDEQGRWDVCGGAIEFGESIDDAVIREVQEELRTKPLDVVFLSAYDAHREHQGAKTHWVQIVHAVRVDPAQVAIGEPHKIAAVDWFWPNNLPEPLHSQFFKSFMLAKDAGFLYAAAD